MHIERLQKSPRGSFPHLQKIVSYTKKQHQLEWRPLSRAVCDFYLESGVIAAGEEHLAVHVDTFHLQNLN